MQVETLTTVAEHRGSEPPRLIRAIRGDLDWIVMKAMEKDRGRRYETASSLALDVERFLANETVSARPPSAFYKFQKLVQRNKLLFLGIGVILALLVTGLVILLTLLQKERQARQQSQEVTQILSEMMTGAGPYVAEGRSPMLLLDILRPTSQRVATELDNQPAVQAQLCGLLARTYLDVGDYAQAEKLDRLALTNNTRLYGAKSAQVAASFYDLGTALWKDAKWAEAEKPHLEALSIRQQLFGPTNAEVAASMNGLGCVYREEWRLPEADPLIRRALAIRRQLFPGNNFEVAESLQSFCHLLEAERRWPEAEATAREFVAMCTNLPGREYLVADALDDLAMAAGFNGKLDAQEAANKQAFVIKQAFLPEGHPYVVKSIANLGEVLRLRGKLTEASDVLKAAISIQRKLLGEDYPDTLAAMGSLGQVLASEGKWEAEKVHRDALGLWRKRLGDDNPQSMWEWGQVYDALVAQGKFHEAEQLLGEVLTPAFVKNPACSDMLAHRLDFMGRQGRWAEAIADANLFIEYQPTDQYRYHALATLLAITDDRQAYGTLCRKMVATFTNTTNPYVDQRMAEDCLFLPDSGVDLQFVDKLADKAVAIAGSYGSNYPDMPYFQVVKAMSAYRLGHFTEAIEWAEKTLTGSILYPNAHAYAVLSMAHWQLGQKDLARSDFAKGEALTPDVLHSHEAVDLGDSWVAWLEGRISLDEAGQLIRLDSH